MLPSHSFLSGYQFFLGNTTKKERIPEGFSPKYLRLGFAVATQHINNLVADGLLDGGTGIAKILTGIEMVGVSKQMLAQRSGESKTEIGIDIDLADGHGSCLTQHILRYTLGAGHIATVGVDGGYIGLIHGRSAVQHNGETGQAAGHFLQDIEAELGAHL